MLQFACVYTFLKGKGRNRNICIFNNESDKNLNIILKICTQIMKKNEK